MNLSEQQLNEWIEELKEQWRTELTPPLTDSEWSHRIAGAAYLKAKILAELSAQPERELEWRARGVADEFEADTANGGTVWVYRNRAGSWTYWQTRIADENTTLDAAKSLAAKLAAVLDGGEGEG